MSLVPAPSGLSASVAGNSQGIGSATTAGDAAAAIPATGLADSAAAP